MELRFKCHYGSFVFEAKRVWGPAVPMVGSSASGPIVPQLSTFFPFCILLKGCVNFREYVAIGSNEMCEH